MSAAMSIYSHSSSGRLPPVSSHPSFSRLYSLSYCTIITYLVLGRVCADMVLIHQQLDRAVQAALVPFLDIIIVVVLVPSFTSAIDCKMGVMMCRTDSSSASVILMSDAYDAIARISVGDIWAFAVIFIFHHIGYDCLPALCISASWPNIRVQSLRQRASGTSVTLM